MKIELEVDFQNWQVFIILKPEILREFTTLANTKIE